jgi:hypothetical protein
MREAANSSDCVAEVRWPRFFFQNFEKRFHIVIKKEWTSLKRFHRPEKSFRNFKEMSPTVTLI